MAKEPKLGNIYTPSGVLIGFRAFDTKEFTGINGWTLEGDNVCETNTLLLDEDTGLAFPDEDTGEFVFDGDV